MPKSEPLAEKFEKQRPRLLAGAYRMLGSRSEAEDAVQEAWLRLSGTEHAKIGNLCAWLTTVVGRISLNMLRSRKARSETYVPEPLLDSPDGVSPEHATLLQDGVSLALLVVLDTLTPAERVAFVLHDIFALAFEEIAPIVDRTPDAARQLASRARRRVQSRNIQPDADLATQCQVVEAFRAAALSGDLNGLIAVLDPDVVLRTDGGSLGGASIQVRGAEQVARRAHAFSRIDLLRRPALVNGAPGLINLLDGKPFSVMAFAVRSGKIVAMDILRDPERLRHLALVR